MRHTLNRNEKIDMNISGLPSICAVITGLLFMADVTPCYAQDAPGTIFNDCDDCPTMVVIPPGDFIMGSERGEFVLNETRPETPVHGVTIRRAFAAGGTDRAASAVASVRACSSATASPSLMAAAEARLAARSDAYTARLTP